jgi:hypothetical protein
MGTWTYSHAVAVGLTSLLATLLVAGATAQGPAPIVRTGAHAVLHVHPGALAPALAERLADEAQRSAESAWPLIDDLLGTKLQKPVTLHVYADEPMYRAAATANGGTLPLESFARLAENEAHVLLWPLLSVKAVALVGLPEPTRQELIARCAQLAAVQAAPFAVADPWLGEVFGYAVLEETVNPKHQFGCDPAYDARRAKVWQKLVDRQQVLLHPKILDFAARTTRAEHDDHETDKCLVARMLAASGKGWAKKLFAKPPKKATIRSEIRSAAVDRVLGTDWLKTESLFTKHCQTIRPVWRETAPMSSWRDGKLCIVGTAEKAQQMQALEPPPSGDYRIRGRFTILPCNDSAFRLQLDWREGSMIGCFFGVGKFSIEKWSTGNEWQTLAEGKAPIVAGKPFDAAVEVGKHVKLFADGVEIASWDPGTRTMRGYWSVGVNDCVVHVEGLQLESIAAKR